MKVRLSWFRYAWLDLSCSKKAESTLAQEVIDLHPSLGRRGPMPDVPDLVRIRNRNDVSRIPGGTRGGPTATIHAIGRIPDPSLTGGRLRETQSCGRPFGSRAVDVRPSAGIP